MNLILLSSIFLVASVLLLPIYGKSVQNSPENGDLSYEVKNIGVGRNINDEDIDNFDILGDKLEDIITSYYYDKTQCPPWSLIDPEVIIEESMRSLFEAQCMRSCRLQVLENILAAIQCTEGITQSFKRDRRLSSDFLSREDLFVPVRGRRKSFIDQSSISAEKKAKLDVLANDLFVPNRGKRHLVRKNFLKLNSFPVEKRNNIELDMKEFFVPNRGKK